MKRLVIILSVLCLTLVSCGKADVVIRTDLSATRASAYIPALETTAMTAAVSEWGMMIFVVNISSKTFHISDECYHVKNMKEENKSTVESVSIEQMIADGYKPCSTCIGKE